MATRKKTAVAKKKAEPVKPVDAPQDEVAGSKAVVEESSRKCPCCGGNRIRVGSVTCQCEICYAAFLK